MQFSYFCPNPLPEGIFRGSKCPSIIKSTILERPLISRGAENGPIIPNNISKNDKKSSRANYGDPLGADLGALYIYSWFYWIFGFVVRFMCIYLFMSWFCCHVFLITCSAFCFVSMIWSSSSHCLYFTDIFGVCFVCLLLRLWIIVVV